MPTTTTGMFTSGEQKVERTEKRKRIELRERTGTGDEDKDGKMRVRLLERLSTGEKEKSKVG